MTTTTEGQHHNNNNKSAILQYIINANKEIEKLDADILQLERIMFSDEEAYQQYK